MFRSFIHFMKLMNGKKLGATRGSPRTSKRSRSRVFNKRFSGSRNAMEHPRSSPSHLVASLPSIVSDLKRVAAN